LNLFEKPKETGISVAPIMLIVINVEDISALGKKQE